MRKRKMKPAAMLLSRLPTIQHREGYGAQYIFQLHFNEYTTQRLKSNTRFIIDNVVEALCDKLY